METSAPLGSFAVTVLLKWGVAATRPASSRHSVAARAIVLFIGTSVAEARSVDPFSGSLLTQGDDRVETRRASGRKPRRRQPDREEDRRDAGEHERAVALTSKRSALSERVRAPAPASPARRLMPRSATPWRRKIARIDPEPAPTAIRIPA